MSNSVVYFIQSENGGPVKIGRTRDLQQRLRGLQTAASDAFIALRTVSGYMMVERWFHDRFADRHISGEWFSFQPEMLTDCCPQGLVDADLASSIQSPCVITTDERFREIIQTAVRRWVGDNPRKSFARDIQEKYGISYRTIENYLEGKCVPNGAQLFTLMTASPEVASAVLGPMCQAHYSRLARAIDAIEVAKIELQKQIEAYGLPLNAAEES